MLIAATQIGSLGELKTKVGQEVAASDWFEVTQGRINQFAEATEDRQWIHTDPERAARESPFRATIAHGFLTLSLLSELMRRAVSVGGVRMGVNYGLNRVRFVRPVPAGARAPLHAPHRRRRAGARSDVPARAGAHGLRQASVGAGDDSCRHREIKDGD